MIDIENGWFAEMHVKLKTFLLGNKLLLGKDFTRLYFQLLCIAQPSSSHRWKTFSTGILAWFSTRRIGKTSCMILLSTIMVLREFRLPRLTTTGSTCTLNVRQMVRRLALVPGTIAVSCRPCMPSQPPIHWGSWCYYNVNERTSQVEDLSAFSTRMGKTSRLHFLL